VVLLPQVGYPIVGIGLPNQMCTISRGITPCASTVLVLLLKKTSTAGLTIASAVSGQVAKLQSVHGVHYLRFCSDRGVVPEGSGSLVTL